MFVRGGSIRMVAFGATLWPIHWPRGVMLIRVQLCVRTLQLGNSRAKWRVRAPKGFSFYNLSLEGSVNETWIDTILGAGDCVVIAPHMVHVRYLRPMSCLIIL